MNADRAAPRKTDSVAVGEPYWTVVWDYIGGDCGDLPWRFETEDEAEEAGQDWVDDTLHYLRESQPDLAEGDEGYPVYHVIPHEPPKYPVWKEGARWICDGPNGRFHAHTKTEAIRLLRETGGRYDDKMRDDEVARRSLDRSPQHNDGTEEGR